MRFSIDLVPPSEIGRIVAQLRPSKSPSDCLFLPGFFGIVLNTHRVVYVKIQGVWCRTMLHQLMYEWRYGTVPPGLLIRHLCGWGGCANYRHLAAGTRRENGYDLAFHNELPRQPPPRRGLHRVRFRRAHVSLRWTALACRRRRHLAGLRTHGVRPRATSARAGYARIRAGVRAAVPRRRDRVLAPARPDEHHDNEQ